MARAEVRRHRSLGVDGGSEVQKEASTLEALLKKWGEQRWLLFLLNRAV